MSGYKRLAKRLSGALALAFALAGCAGLAPQPQPAPPAFGQPRAYHQTIELSGRLSVRYQRDGKDEALHGSFVWSQNPQRTQVLLQSPLGQTIAAIDIEPGSATLTQAGQAPRSAADVDALTAATLGWPLPVSGLRDWLQGFSADRAGRRAPAAPQAEGETILTADGWRVRFVGWEPDAAAGSMRPKRIDLERSTMHAGAVAIRIVSDSWQAG
jgi:outer membrane lipoprotein LolB